VPLAVVQLEFAEYGTQEAASIRRAGR